MRVERLGTPLFLALGRDPSPRAFQAEPGPEEAGEPFDVAEIWRAGRLPSLENTVGVVVAVLAAIVPSGTGHKGPEPAAGRWPRLGMPVDMVLEDGDLVGRETAYVVGTDA